MTIVGEPIVPILCMQNLMPIGKNGGFALKTRIQCRKQNIFLGGLNLFSLIFAIENTYLSLIKVGA